ncbi:GNAT family N-acetyltransferase [Aquibacillus sediminis]|uniref:GNAT family N-acetyltransferase n=1 Tax=Aquibacillus sediminis TaxID=2574734 RepID=UPI00110818A8|nr:GNAT family N-acetyltransferase [Aquibacillus sediminis]
MDIRQLDSKDAEKYLAIRLEALQNSPDAFASSYEEERDQPVEKYQNRFEAPKNAFTFGAFEDDQLVGVITLVKEQLIKLRHRANMVAMYVRPEKRGEGIGKALITKAIQKAVSLEDIEQLYLTVVTTNDPAKRLYASIGFEIFGHEKRALKFGDTYYDEEHMVFYL